MREELLEKLRPVTAEEARLLGGEREVEKELYSSGSRFVIHAQKLVKKGTFLEIRPHTRFVHFPPHLHNYVEMVYMCEGETTHIINHTDRVVLKKGDLLMMNQNAVHEVLAASEQDIAVNFIILPEFFRQSMETMEQDGVLFPFLVSTLAGANSTADYLHFMVRDLLPIQNIMENMIWNLLEKKDHSGKISQLSMELLLLNLMDYTETIDQKNENQMEQHLVFSALNYIKSNYKAGTLEEFCETVHQKPYTVSRMLKRHTGQNFKELLMEQKLSQAAYLLTKTDLPTETVFHGIGYENSSFFYRKFKEKYGCSPRAYRKNHREE